MELQPLQGVAHTTKVRAAGDDGLIRERLAALGYEVIALAPAQMAQLIREETRKWAKVIRESGARPE